MARSTVIQVKNRTGRTLTVGKLVYMAGFDHTSQVPLIDLADCRYEDKMPAIGIILENADSGEDVIKIKTLGIAAGLNTSEIAVNTPVYVGYDGNVTYHDVSDDNEEYIIQQVGVVAKSADSPTGQIDLLPLEVRRRVKHPKVINVEPDQHHKEYHAEHHTPIGEDPFIHAVQHHIKGGDPFVHADQHQSGGGDPFVHAGQHTATGSDPIDHATLSNQLQDVHTQYSLVDGTRAFTGTVGGITPTGPTHLTTKNYVDNVYTASNLGAGNGIFASKVGTDFRFKSLIAGSGVGISVNSNEITLYTQDISFVWADPVIKVYNHGPPQSNWPSPDDPGYPPSTGDRYIIGTTPHDSWAGCTDKVAQWNGSSWTIFTPSEGWSLWNKDLDSIFTYTAAWPSGIWKNVTSGNPGGTTGLIQYNNGGTFGGATSLYWNSTNGNFGVGTASPIEALSINGRIALQEQTVAAADQDGYGKLYAKSDGRLYFKSGQGTHIEYDLTSGGTAVQAAQGADGYIAFFTGANGIAGDNDFFWDRANNRVGIGITAPVAKFHVMGDVRIDGTMPNVAFRESSALTDEKLWFDQYANSGIRRSYIANDANSTSNVYFEVNRTGITVDSIEFKTGTAQGPTALFIDSSQRTGLGTSSSFTERLNVNGAIKIGAASGTTDGTIQWTGTDFQGRKSGSWVSLTGGGGSGTPGGSDHQVQYNNGGSFGGAAQLYYDDTNNRVGINTSSPATKLDIKSATQYDGLTVRNASNVIAQIVGFTAANDNAGLDLYAGGVLKVRLNSDASVVSYINSGANFGIGTSSPATRLVVETPTQYNGFIVKNASNTIANIIGYAAGNDAGGLELYNGGGTAKISLRTDASVNSYINTSGANFGIGTTTPAEKLDVNGAVKIGTTSNTNAGTIRWTGTDFEGRTGSAWVSLTATGSGAPGGSTGYVQYNNGGAFAGESNLFWDAANDRLGIATATPAYNLDIDTAVTTSAKFGASFPVYIVAPSPNIGFNAYYATSNWRYGKGSTSHYGVLIGADPATGYFAVWSSAAAGTADAAITTSQVLTVLRTGKVGIGSGNTSPTESLEMSGAVKVGSASGTADGTIQWTGSDFQGRKGGTWVSLTGSGGGTITGSGVAGQATYWNGTSSVTGSNNFWWDNTNTRLGLGTNAPANTLSVNGAASIGAYATTSAPANSLIISGYLGVGTSSPSAGTDLYVYRNSSDTSVGIMCRNDFGTSNAESSIAAFVNGSGYMQMLQVPASSSRTFFGINNSQSSVFISRSPSAAMFVGIESNAPLYFGTNNLTRATILAGGNFGIGTTSPAERLEVNGAIKIGTNAATNDGTIRWTGTDFEGRKSGSWVSFTAGASGLTASQGADGYLAFFTGASALAGDNDLFWDRANNRLGVGTSAPVVKLDIVSTLGGTSNPTTQLTSITDRSGMMFVSFAEGVGGTQPVGGIFAQAASGWVSALRFVLNSNWGAPTNEAMIIKSSSGTTTVGIGTTSPASMLSVNGGGSFGYPTITAPANGLIVAGNVGIGKNSASSTLDVAGTTTTNYLVINRNDVNVIIDYNPTGSWGGNTKNYWLQSVRGAGSGFGPDGSFGLWNQTNSRAQWMITHDGKMGVGLGWSATVIPSSTLDVLGDSAGTTIANFASSTSGTTTSTITIKGFNSSGAPRATIGFLTGRGTSSAPTTLIVGDAVGELVFAGNFGTTPTVANIASIRAQIDSGTVSNSSAPSLLQFSTTPDGSLTRTERMRISSAGLVGINTVSPTEQLTVNGAVNIGTTSNTNNGTIRYTGTDFEGRKAGAWVSLTSGAGVTASQGFDGYIAFFTGANAIAGDNDLFWDRANNRLGIGTSVPTVLLDVAGQGKFSSATFAPLLAERTTSQTNSVYGALQLRHTTSADMVDGFGPSVTFYAKDISAVDNYLGSIGAARSGADNSGRLTFTTLSTGTATEKMTIMPDGKVGIGTVAPLESLEINGALKLGTSVDTNNGTIRWTGSDFEGRKGGAWVSLTGTGSGGGDLTKAEQYPINHALVQAADGYGVAITNLQRIDSQQSTWNNTVRVALDGYGVGSGDLTKAEQYPINHALVQAADGYGILFSQQSTWNNTVRAVLDGYETIADANRLFSQQSTWNDTVTKSLDGYQNEINTIIASLDAYGSGVGDITGSGADGYVTYWTGTKTVSGSKDLYFDHTDGYLGIGTNVPDERLVVSGAISMKETLVTPPVDPEAGKLYVTPDGKLMFVRQDGERFNLTSYVGDIDGGTFLDTYINVGHINAGWF